MTEGWRACEEWVTPDGEVDLERTVSLFGEARIRATPSDRCCPPPGESSLLRLYIQHCKLPVDSARLAGASGAQVADVDAWNGQY